MAERIDDMTSRLFILHAICLAFMTSENHCDITNKAGLPNRVQDEAAKVYLVNETVQKVRSLFLELYTESAFLVKLTVHVMR